MKKIKISIYAIVAALAVKIILGIYFRQPSPLDAIYGRWQIEWFVDDKYIKEPIEFHQKYFIENGVQYNNPKYIYDILPDVYCIEDSGRDIERLKIYYEDKIDFDGDCLQVRIMQYRYRYGLLWLLVLYSRYALL